MARQYYPFQLVKFLKGFLLPSGNDLNQNFSLSYGGTTGITAHAGGGQANAVPLTAFINVISTVATGNDSVQLPSSQYMSPGQEIVVVNDAAVNSLQVFGNGLDTINDVATATGVAQAAGKTASYYLASYSAGVGKWYRVLSA